MPASGHDIGGAAVSRSRYVPGGAGRRPRGTDRFSCATEPYGKVRRWDFYTCWMEMRSCDRGRHYWGNDFVNDGDFRVERGRWICVELMVKLNSAVSERNGEQAMWIDGELRSKDGQVINYLGPGFPRGRWTVDSWHPDPEGEPFEGYRWRRTPRLKINYLWMLVCITTAPAGHVSKVWFDDVVVAREYIGPMKPREGRLKGGRPALPGPEKPAESEP